MYLLRHKWLSFEKTPQVIDMQYFLLECKRMFTNKRFIIGCLIVFVFLLCGAYDMFLPGYDLVEAMIFSLGANATAILALFWTILGSVPWAVSFFEERECGYQKYLQSKVGSIKYLVSKYCSNTVAAFAVILLPEFVLFFIFLLMKGINVNLKYCMDISYMPQIARSHPIIYCILLMLATALATAAYSGLCMASSVYIKNKFIAIVIPFIVYIVTCLTLRSTGLFWLSGSFLYDLNDWEKPCYGLRSLVGFGIIIICFFIFVWGNQNEEKN